MRKRLWLYVVFVGMFFCGVAQAESMQKILAEDGADGDMFGYSVSISGNTALIGGGQWQCLRF